MREAGHRHIPICVLAGGLSTRLRPITETVPKPMVDVAGEPFLKRILDHLASVGYRQFILAVSYRWEVVREYFGDGGAFGWRIEYSVEPEPLGTGGAVLWAQPLWGERVLVLNGDTHLPANWPAMVESHASGGLPATMAVVRAADTGRFGSVQVAGGPAPLGLAPLGRVTAFQEKARGAGWINGGAYVLDRDALAGRRRGERFSLERDVFGALAGRIGAFPCEGIPFADIGTVDALQRFRQEAESHSAKGV